jgi:chorismate mutase
MSREKIDSWRAEIDRIDEQLLALFNQRAHCAIEIGLLKRKLGVPIDVPEREAAIIAWMTERNAGPLDADAVRRLFEAVIGESRIAESAILES